MTTIYVAEYNYGKMKIAQVDVIKETAKTLQVDDKTGRFLRGGWMYIPNRIDKGKGNTFVALREAELWCLEKMRQHQTQLHNELGIVEANIAALEAEIGGDE